MRQTTSLRPNVALVPALPRQVGRRSRRVLVVLVGSLLASNAFAIDLYDAGREKDATAAKAAWHSIDLNSFIAAEQANLRSLLAAELSAQDDLAIATRNNHLRAFIETPLHQSGADARGAAPFGLLDLIDRKLTQEISVIPSPTAATYGSAGVVGRFDRKYAAWIAAVSDYEYHLQVAQPIYIQFGLGDDPQCADAAIPRPARVQAALDKLSSKDQHQVTGILDDMRANTCAHVPDATFDASDLPGGTLEAAVNELKDARSARKRATNAVNLARDEYSAALAAYDQAVQANAGDSSPDAKTRVEEDIRKVAAALDRFDTLALETHGLSTRYIAQLRLEKLKTFLDTVTAGTEKAAPANATKTESDFLLVSTLIDGARQSLADAKTPLNVPLSLYRDQQQLRLTAATLQVAAWDEEIELLQKLVTLQVQELHQLVKAHALLTSPETRTVKMQRFLTVRFSEACEIATPDEKEQLISSAVAFLDAVGRLDAQRYKLLYQRSAARHDQVLANDAVNVKRWQALISVSTDQVSDFYAGGIKPETWSGLFNSLMLLGIGVGVNK